MTSDDDGLASLSMINNMGYGQGTHSLVHFIMHERACARPFVRRR